MYVTIDVSLNGADSQERIQKELNDYKRKGFVLRSSSTYTYNEKFPRFFAIMQNLKIDADGEPLYSEEPRQSRRIRR